VKDREMQREKNSIFKCMKKYRTELKRFRSDYKQEEIAELIYAQSKTEIESTTVQYSWQCTVSLLRIQYI
jgi:predicted HAD superfamily Cof-like phosphohydrolase